MSKTNADYVSIGEGWKKKQHRISVDQSSAIVRGNVLLQRNQHSIQITASSTSDNYYSAQAIVGDEFLRKG